MKKEKVLVNMTELRKVLNYMERDEYKHYMSYESPRPTNHIYMAIKSLKKELNS